MHFVEIEGTLQELRALHGIEGLKLQGGERDLGGGRWRASATVTRNEAFEEMKRRGLTVHVTMDEDEALRRQRETQEMMKEVLEQERAEREAKRKEGPKKP
jgi:hypothetical protein